MPNMPKAPTFRTAWAGVVRCSLYLGEASPLRVAQLGVGFPGGKKPV